MGRNAGWIAAATGLAKRYEDDAPHIILLPEVPFIIEKFCDDVAYSLTHYNRCFVVCGEGVKTPDGKYLGEAGGSFSKDSFGHTQLGGAANTIRAIIEEKVGVKARTNRAGTAQRVARHFASATDVEEAYLVGQKAVEAAIEGVSGKMVTIERVSDDPYQITTGLCDLELVANGEKPVAPEFINENGTHITDAFRRYAGPLVMGEAPLDMGDDGLPNYTRFNRALVEKLT
jgi:6-phosphofructokinase